MDVVNDSFVAAAQRGPTDRKRDARATEDGGIGWNW
jgi:hypothetical protein